MTLISISRTHFSLNLSLHIQLFTGPLLCILSNSPYSKMKSLCSLMSFTLLQWSLISKHWHYNLPTHSLQPEPDLCLIDSPSSYLHPSTLRPFLILFELPFFLQPVATFQLGLSTFFNTMVITSLSTGIPADPPPPSPIYSLLCSQKILLKCN